MLSSPPARLMGNISVGMEAIPDELASLIREWASGDVRTMDEIPAKIRGYFQIKEEE